MLAAESALVVGHTLKVILLDPPAGGDFLPALKARLASRLARVPRFRQRLVDVPFGLGRPVWADDPSFDLDRHVRSVPARSPIDADGLGRLVAERMVQRLERDRPLWSVDVVEPLEADGVALLWKVHHSVADGLGVLAIAEQLFWDGEDGDPETPAGTAAVRALPSGTRLVTDALEDHGRTLGEWLTRPWLRGGPAARVGARRAELQVVARELLPASPGSPLDARISRERRVAFVDRPLEEVKAVAHAASRREGVKVTVNDVVLAWVAGGIRTWLQSRHAELADVRVSVPVALHHEREPHVLGNDVCDVYLTLPIHEPDPVRRLLLLSAEMRQRKEAGDAEALDRLSRAVGPAGQLLGELESSARTFGLAVSNVPGPDRRVSVAGTPVRTLHSLAEIAQRHALRVAVVSYDGRISFGLCADAAAVPDLDVLADGVVQTAEDLAAR